MDRLQEFQELVWAHYEQQGRDLPWRHEPFNAYQILVSELMLQQTQVTRVIPKYLEFVSLFPTAQKLAEATLTEVIGAWSGLGYNRRAKYLHVAAKVLVAKPEPWSIADLVACKGIGHNTAAAVVTYAYNQPVPFIETNIRSVYIHHFFIERNDVTDKELLPLITGTIDIEHPREWFWALMDYGSFLKSTVGNASRASKHYTKQSLFEGSSRQIRGQILRILHEQPTNTLRLKQIIPDQRLIGILTQLMAEKLIKKLGSTYLIAD